MIRNAILVQYRECFRTFWEPISELAAVAYVIYETLFFFPLFDMLRSKSLFCQLSNKWKENGRSRFFFHFPAATSRHTKQPINRSRDSFWPLLMSLWSCSILVGPTLCLSIRHFRPLVYPYGRYIYEPLDFHSTVRSYQSNTVGSISLLHISCNPLPLYRVVVMGYTRAELFY